MAGLRFACEAYIMAGSEPCDTADGAATPAAAPSTSPVPVAEQDQQRQRPRAHRVAEGAWVGGVCTGLAEHLGWPVMVLRIGFVVLALVQFVGLVVYAVLWLALPAAPATENAPGLASHDRTNLRTQHPRRAGDRGAVAALGLLAIGLLWLVQASGMGLSAQIFWPIAFAGAGVALLGVVPGELDWAGMAMALGAGVFWAAYILIAGPVGRRWSGASGLTVACIVGAVLLAGPGLAFSGPELLSPYVLGLALVVALLASVVPYGLELSARRSLSSGTFGILMSLEPAAAALLAWLIVGEMLGWQEWLALVCVVAASVGATTDRRRAMKPE